MTLPSSESGFPVSRASWMLRRNVSWRTMKRCASSMRTYFVTRISLTRYAPPGWPSPKLVLLVSSVEW
ncbi:hypothetical protein M5689_013208 [Euphorbia peplus]|nr:hypothetical protein M5689_013208 [Euphorbia peplus]